MTAPTPAIHNSAARQRVIDGACELFIESGYVDVSMQQIADRVGITKATLYHHFRDKEALFVDCMRHQFTQSRDTFERAIADPTSFEEVLFRTAEHILSEDRTDIMRLMSDFRRHVSADSQQAFWCDFRQPWAYLEEAARHAMTTGELLPGDPRLIARMAFGALIGTLKMHRETDRPKAGDATQVVGMLMNGLAPHGAKSEK